MPTALVTWAELRFRAMGTAVHLAVLGDAGALVDARARIEELEARWSRFRPTSVLCRLNAARGRPVMVDAETFDLVVTAVAAWHGTAHLFDPTVLDAVEAAGYDRTFDQLDGLATRAPSGAAPGCLGIHLDPELLRVQLPDGVHLDLGGIGKGRTADLVATELVAAGAEVAMVNLGGDLRIAGEVTHGAFPVAIEDPLDLGATAATVDLASGALATSSRARRRWLADGVEQHHLIDPATGLPAGRDVLAVTVLADECTRAEVLAKAALVAGLAEGQALLLDARLPALLVTEDGARHRVGGFGGFER
jgi:thiamine biosynthesis lipoprotein